MRRLNILRRKFIGTASTAAFGSAAFGLDLVYAESLPGKSKKDIVSIVHIKELRGLFL